MNPTYKVGDVVQIISEEEVYSCPTDDRGNFILARSSYGLYDLFQREKLPVCGCPAVIAGISEIGVGNLYKLTPFFAKDKTVFPWDDWFFFAAEFHPLMDLLSVVSPPPVSFPSISFDDLLKGVAQ
jgi:hypothetical protein